MYLWEQIDRIMKMVDFLRGPRSNAGQAPCKYSKKYARYFHDFPFICQRGVLVRFSDRGPPANSDLVLGLDERA